MTRHPAILTVVVGSVLTLSSCSAIDVNALPAPGNSFSGGYDVILEFQSVLNLPARAKVTLDGLTVGIVTQTAIAGDHVNVTSRIDPTVAVPSSIHASLQQATVLGDIYVALDRSPNDETSVPLLREGSTVPLSQTTSPPQLEDTIAQLANFVGSGSIQRIQNTIISLNRVTPSGDHLRKVVSTFAADIAEVSDSIDNVDLLLNSTAQTAQVLHNRIPAINRAFSPQGMVDLYNTIEIAKLVSNGFPSIGSVYSQGYWIVPLLSSLANAFGAIQESKWAFEKEVPAWRRLFTDFFLPQDRYPAINITSIVGPDGREMSGDITNVLRMLGAMP